MIRRSAFIIVRPFRTACASLVAFAVLIVGALDASAQGNIYPTELYSGINPITIRAGDGIRLIEVKYGGEWRPLVLGLKTRHYKVISAPIAGSCAKTGTITLFIERIDLNFRFEIRVTECDGSRKQYALALDNTWNLFHEDFGTITLDDRPCHTFRVESGGGSFIIDRVEIAARGFTIHYPFKKPPVSLRGVRTYRYTVCYTPQRLGQIKVPVNVHIRRPQPVGKYDTYIVADTAYVTVVAPTNRGQSPVVSETFEPPPKPDPPRFPTALPSTPPDPPVQATNVEPIAGDTSTPRTLQVADFDSERPRDSIPDIPMPTWIHDPSTFRVILTPSARSIGKNKGFVSSYDVGGIVAGYGVTDRLSVVGGGVAVPVVTSPLYAATAGLKYELVNNAPLHVSSGIQANVSTTDESTIVSAVPFVTANYGTLDYGINATVGYSWRQHDPKGSLVPVFTRTALVGGLGGDVRFARHWKIAGEIFIIESAEFQPAAATLRWFNDRLAVDAGLAVNLKGTGDIPVLPVVSLVWVW